MNAETAAKLLTELENIQIRVRADESRIVEIRKAFAEQVGVLDEGMNLCTFGGVRVKITHKLNRTVNQQNLRDFLFAGTFAQLATPFPELFATKYDLTVGAYRAACTDDKLLLQDIVTEKPGSPAVERAK